MKKIYTSNFFSTKGLLAILFFCSGYCLKSQNVLIPFSGSTSVNCGSNVMLQAHNGSSGQYANNANGYVVLNAGFQAVINVAGSYTTEANYDYIRIYNGVGTGGALLATYHGQNLTMNYTGTPGQTLTVRFSSDGSVVYNGFNLQVTYTGACFAAPCSGIPGANSVVTPTYAICPNASALLSLANSYTTGGFTYQWQSSTVSPVGPFNSIPSGTNTNLNTGSLAQNTYFQAIITCTNGNGVTTAAVGQVSIQPTIISTVPYYEGFEGIINNNDLPNCSWTSTNPNSITRTYTSAQTQGRVARTGNKFASFYYSPTGTNYFYTNGIQLNAGVTYSAALWFKTEYYGYLTWSDMSIMLGASQSTTGLTTIATTGGPAASSGYKSLSNTFTVASSGVYYLAVKGANAGICCAYNLNWDDLEVTIPCSINSPSMSVSANSSTICAGEPVTLTAGGADTYTWSTGANGSQIIETPGQTTVYSVMGTNTLSGCPGANLTQLVVVNPTPQLAVVANPNVVCSGQPVTITAFGATSYTWNPSNGNNNSITVSPTLTTTYQLIGSNSFGCQAQMSQVVTVRAKPAVTAISDRAEICRGEAATLTGGGAVTYQWASNSLFVQSGQAIVTPNATTIYTLTGTDANGCQNSTTIMQTVQECVGLGEMTTTLAGVKVYPNPTGGAFVVELNNGAEKMVTVSDVTGRIILSSSSNNNIIRLDINSLANGIYYVKIQSEKATEVVKVIKN